MLSSEQLYSDLKELLKTHTILWSSEQDMPIEAVRIPWYRMLSWKRENDGVEINRLNGQTNFDDPSMPISLLRDMLINQPRLISIKRKTKKPSEYELYILSRWGFFYVGIRAILIET